MSARSLLIHHDAQQRATTIQSYLAQTLLFLLAATLPLAQWQLPFLQSLQKADGGLQFFDLLATIAALFSVFSFLKKPCRAALFPWAYPLALSLPILLHRTPSSAWLLLMKPIYLAGLASTVVTLLSASESRGYRALRYGWLTGWMLTVVATVVGIVWFYLGYTDETNNPFLFHYGSLQKGPYPRIRSTFLNANLYCNYLVVTSGWLRSPKARFALICSALPTLSPALGPLLLVCLWQTSRPRVKAIGILASAAIYLATWTFPSELLSGKFRWSGRVQCWEAAANEWLRAPVFGLGPGQAQVLVEWKNPEGLSGLLTDPHNLVLSVLSQGGLITLLSLFALTWWLSKSSQLDLRRALLGAVWLDGLTGSYEDARHIWVAVGALAAFNPWRKGGSFKDPGPPA